MRHLAGVLLSPEQHEQLTRVCEAGAFPSRYDDWLTIVRSSEAEVLSAGDRVQPVTLDVEDFIAWCQHVGIIPCMDALKAYAIVQRLAANVPPYYGSTYLGPPMPE